MFVGRCRLAGQLTSKPFSFNGKEHPSTSLDTRQGSCAPAESAAYNKNFRNRPRGGLQLNRGSCGGR